MVCAAEFPLNPFLPRNNHIFTIVFLPLRLNLPSRKFPPPLNMPHVGVISFAPSLTSALGKMCSAVYIVVLPLHCAFHNWFTSILFVLISQLSVEIQLFDAFKSHIQKCIGPHVAGLMQLFVGLGDISSYVIQSKFPFFVMSMSFYLGRTKV